MISRRMLDVWARMKRTRAESVDPEEPVQGPMQEKRQGMRNKRQTIEYTNGDVLESTWKLEDGGQYENAILKCSDGSRYEGQWKNGMRNGHGTLRNQEGTYVGQFSHGKKEGRGRFTSKKKAGTYDGQVPSLAFEPCSASTLCMDSTMSHQGIMFHSPATPMLCA